MLNLKLLALRVESLVSKHSISILAFFNSVRTNENDIAVLFQSLLTVKNSVKIFKSTLLSVEELIKG